MTDHCFCLGFAVDICSTLLPVGFIISATVTIQHDTTSQMQHCPLNLCSKPHLQLSHKPHPGCGYQDVDRCQKTTANASCPRAKTKKEVRWFLWLAGYHRWFVTGSVELTNLKPYCEVGGGEDGFGRTQLVQHEVHTKFTPL